MGTHAHTQLWIDTQRTRDDVARQALEHGVVELWAILDHIGQE
jgi:hypothetical protein